MRKPYPHQKQILSYAQQQTHPALFVEMRLGKNLPTIRRCKMYTPRDPQAGLLGLIVAPNSALGSWEEELILESETDYIFLQGTREERLEQLKESHRWYLINKEGFLAIPEIKDIPWDLVVCDESFLRKPPKSENPRSDKSPGSKVSRFFLKYFRDVPHRWLLTGTPAPQNDLEYCPQFLFLDGEFMGCRNYYTFRARYFKKPMFGHNWIPKIGTLTDIKEYLAKRACIIRRSDVNMDVEKVMERRYLTLPKREQKTYNLMTEAMILEHDGEEISRTKFAIVKLQVLRQLCGGCIEKELVWNGKIKELAELLTGELAHNQVVVWFNYNHEIQHALTYLKKKKINVRWADGSVKPEARRELERDFKAGKFRVYLLQIKIAEMGMNLSAADTAIYFSPPFGTLTRTQSMDRILDIRKTEPLLIIDLCIKDSVDTAILDALEQKIFEGRQLLDRVVAIMKKQREAQIA